MANCKVCNQKLSGRSDKKFCSVNCKNRYHIELRKATNIAVADIDKILHRNHSILYEILDDKKAQVKISRLILDKKKFNFKYHTHFNATAKGRIYYYVYDLAWVEFSDDEVLVVNKKKGE